MMKMLDVFKKNQWAVNKVLKQNQLLAKKRADHLESLIEQQKLVIEILQVIFFQNVPKFKSPLEQARCGREKVCRT